ncbi:MAG: PadR family transcriptional regulator [Lachnospiraceae bacterium]|nr:PadR family transcriptional regulator [Lachnospiraceae bacterium]
MPDKTHSFESYYKRTVSPIIVLAVLKKKPMYGYEISAAIREKSGGRYTISIMYPILDNLLEEGYISEHRTLIVEGRARKYYAITPKGEAYLRECLEEYFSLSEVFLHLTREDVSHETESNTCD